MLSIALLAIALIGATTGYVGAVRTHRQQEEELARVVTTLTRANFPLTNRVLRQMSGLSGAEFVVFDVRQQLEACTLDLTPADLERLGQLPVERVSEQTADHPRMQIGARRYLVQRAPVFQWPHEVVRGSLVVLYEEDRWRSAVRRSAYPAIVAGCVAAATAVILATVLARRFVRPIQQLGIETARIAEGRFQPVVVPPCNDELHDLAMAVNAMADKLSHYEQQVRSSERLRTLGQLGAGLAHQLRNWATGARMAIDLHLQECSSGRDSEAIDVALRQLRLMESYLQRFLHVGQGASLSYAEVDLAAVLDDVVELMRPACLHAKIELALSKPAQPLIVWGDAHSLRELLVNLILNAIEAAKRSAGAQPAVAVELYCLESRRAVIRVKDTGPGPGPTTVDHLFEPFITEKPEGSGLGLFVARQIVEAHQGTIGWHRQNDMTCFWIEIPLLSPKDA
jgi:signal transduction histidine kinase